MLSNLTFSSNNEDTVNTVKSGIIPSSISSPIRKYASPIGSSLGILGMNYFKGGNFKNSLVPIGAVFASEFLLPSNLNDNILVNAGEGSLGQFISNKYIMKNNSTKQSTWNWNP